MPVNVPINRLRAFRFRARKGAKIPVVEPLRKRILIDGRWLFSEEEWCIDGKLAYVWCWRLDGDGKPLEYEVEDD